MSTMTKLLTAAGLGALTMFACTRTAGPSAEWTVRIEPTESPAGPASAQPQITTSDRGAVLSWLETVASETTFKFSQRTPDGWSAPRTIVSGDNFFANWADVPSVIRLADGSLVAHWLQQSGKDTYAYDVRLSRSTDEGLTWSPSFTPHHDGTKNEHGFASLFQAPGAGLGLVWLDGRAMKPPAAGDDEGTGDMSLRSALFDRDLKPLAEDAIDLRVCECCPTAAAVTADGPIVAFRNRSPEEVRDIYVSRLVGAKWSEPAAVHSDGWQLNGCPVNGPALSARGRDVAIAWFTAPNDEGHTFVAFSQDAGKTFGAPVRVDEAGSLGRVDLELLPDGSAVVSWIELADKRATFSIRRVERSGQRSAAIAVAPLGANRSSGYPRMAREVDELIFAWTDSDNSLRVQTASAKLP
jgi:hypothetical protein